MLQFIGPRDYSLYRNLTGIAVSFAAVFALLVVVELLIARKLVREATGRKIVHIGASHWWLLAMLFHDNPWFAAVGPAFFLIFNVVIWRRGSMATLRPHADRSNLGTIYFPLSLLAIVFLTFGGVFPVYTGGIGILIMGWGDGLAALVGERVKSGRYAVAGRSNMLPNAGIDTTSDRATKSIAGSLTMFAASFTVGAILVGTFCPQAGLATVAARAGAVAGVATIVEAVTPFGLDNLTVPILSVLFYNLVIL
ncbi:MAG TPA: hypothetical protein VMW87_01890 [Spirochaetia bacterium]|nr:hypothetical protein [Spirochaetia bacterium]